MLVELEECRFLRKQHPFEKPSCSQMRRGFLLTGLTPEVWKKCANFKKQSGFPDGRLHSSLCERQRQILSIDPAAKIKTQWGFWKSRHFTCKLHHTFRSTLRYNERIQQNKEIFFSAGPPDKYRALVSFCEVAMRSTIRL